VKSNHTVRLGLDALPGVFPGSEKPSRHDTGDEPNEALRSRCEEGYCSGMALRQRRFRQLRGVRTAGRVPGILGENSTTGVTIVDGARAAMRHDIV
jgi:hypothetical protein